MVARHRAFAGPGFGKRNAEALGKFAQRPPGLRVFHAAAAHQQRFALGGQQRQRVRQHAVGRRAAIEPMHAFWKK